MKHILIIALILSFGFAQDFEYVGTKKCGSCHKKEEQGAQLGKWESGSHAGAFETLKSEEAIKIAQEKGLEMDPWEAAECLKCHTTGYGAGGYEVKDEAFWNPAADDRKGKKAVKLMSALQAVGCESCHGPGSEYKSKKKMKAIYAGEVDGATLGLMPITEETCVGCHNEESPTFKAFDFAKQKDEIAHPYPEGYTPKK